MLLANPRTPVDAVKDRLRREHREVIDLTTDREWLHELTPQPDLLLFRMAQAKIAHRIQRGRYVVNVVDDVPSSTPLLDALETLPGTLLARLNMPGYLSWHTALFYHGLLEQQSTTVFCAVPRRKRDAVFFGYRIRFVTVSPSRFFGIEPVREFDGHVRLATVEKALIDAIERPDLSAPFPVLLAAVADAAASSMIDVDKLVAYTIETERPSLTRRVGFLMDLNGLPGSDRLQDHIGGRPLESLVPGGSRTDGDVDARWRLRIPESMVLSSEQLK